MTIDWEEINGIIRERSSRSSYMVRPNEMDSADLAKIHFLIDEVLSFPDDQKTVSDSGALLDRHLSQKYRGLDPDNISRLVHLFCYMNK